MTTMTTAFAPTHEIVFTPVTGAPRTILVALTDEGGGIADDGGQPPCQVLRRWA